MNFFVSTLNDSLAEAKTVEIDKETEQAVTAGQPVNTIVDKTNGVNVSSENKENERKGEKMREGETTERGNRAIFFVKISKCLTTRLSSMKSVSSSRPLIPFSCPSCV